jgi:hypothetical protein
VLRAVVLALLGTTTIASAGETEQEDPKAAIAERGIVLEAGKRHFVVIVPPREKPAQAPDNSTLYKATIYFGDSKTLFQQAGVNWDTFEADENRDIDDPRRFFESRLVRKGADYELRCKGIDDKVRRIVPLKVATAKSVAKASLKSVQIPFTAYGLFRMPKATTYLYVDIAAAASEYRLYVGKRGAMKRIKIKESAEDEDGLVLVTATDTLAVKKLNNGRTEVTATWGPAKKPVDIAVLKIGHNMKLVYKDLGVYARDRTGYPCDEL